MTHLFDRLRNLSGDPLQRRYCFWHIVVGYVTWRPTQGEGESQE